MARTGDTKVHVSIQKAAALEALTTVEDRQEKYGPPDENFETIGKLWNTYISRKHGAPGTDKYLLFDTHDVAMMMLLVKVAREAHQHNRDNIVDIIGYAECLDRLT